jgi:hypothetical protein
MIRRGFWVIGIWVRLVIDPRRGLLKILTFEWLMVTSITRGIDVI